MTKHETRQIESAAKAVQMGMHDFAARTLSCIYRSTMGRKTQKEVIDWASKLGVVNHKDFII